MMVSRRSGINADSVRTITDYAKIFQLHPRTIVRHLLGEDAETHWMMLQHRTVTIRDLSAKFGMDPKWIVRHLRGDDTIITEEQARLHAGVGRFKFWLDGYPEAARIEMKNVRFARYSNKNNGRWIAAPKP